MSVPSPGKPISAVAHRIHATICTLIAPPYQKVSMAQQTDSAQVDRLIQLLMMLPDPEHAHYHLFWEQVAKENNVGFEYVTDNIAAPLHQILLYPDKDQRASRKFLAGYTLFFFGEPSAALLAVITEEIGAPDANSVPGQMWAQQVRATAFEVLLESQSEQKVRRACANWMRSAQERDL